MLWYIIISYFPSRGNKNYNNEAQKRQCRNEGEVKKVDCQKDFKTGCRYTPALWKNPHKANK